MEWLNVVDMVVGVVMVFVTITLVLITRRYVLLTGELVESNKKFVKTSNKPEILVYLRPDNDNFLCVNLCVENVGPGLACNVRFIPDDPSFAPGDEISLGDIGFIKNKIEYWGPGHKIENFLTSVVGKQDLFERGPFKINVTYEDSENAKYDRNFSLDFKQWENLSKVPSNFSKAVDALEGIEKNFKKISER